MLYTEITHYDELCIEVEAKEGRYWVKVTARIPGEEAESEIEPCVLPLMERSEETLATLARSPRDKPILRGAVQEPEDAVKELGVRLYKALFHRSGEAVYQRTMRRVEALSSGALRIRLIAQAPEVLALPWEFLFDPQRGDFVSLLPRTLLVRQRAQPTVTATAASTQRITLHQILSTHFSLDELRMLGFQLGVEYENLGGDTLNRKALELVMYMERNGRLPDLQAALKALRPHAFTDPEFDSVPAAPPPTLTSPLRLLVATAPLNASMAEGLQKEVEMLRGLEREMPGRLVLTVLERVTAEQFLEAIRGEPYHIIHFGGIGRTRGGGKTALEWQGLALRDASERETHLPAHLLQEALQHQNDLWLFYFAAGYTEGLAAQLSADVPAAIGVRSLILGPALRSFAQTFYRTLLAYQPLESAITQGRHAINQENQGSREWGLIGCYLNWPEGGSMGPPQSASVDPDDVPLDPTPTPPEGKPADPTLQKEWDALHIYLEQSRAELRDLESKLALYGSSPPDFLQSYRDDLRRTITETEAQIDTLKAG